MRQTNLTPQNIENIINALLILTDNCGYQT